MIMPIWKCPFMVLNKGHNCIGHYGWKLELPENFCCKSPVPNFYKWQTRPQMMQINQPTRCNSFTSLLLDVYVWLNMFRAPLRPSSGAYNCTRSLWFYRWSIVGHGRKTMTNNAPTAMLQRQNQRLLVQLYAPDDGRRGAPKHVEPHINIK